MAFRFREADNLTTGRPDERLVSWRRNLYALVIAQSPAIVSTE